MQPGLRQYILLFLFNCCSKALLTSSVEAQLLKLQASLSLANSTLTCWGDDYTGSRDDFLQHKYDALIEKHVGDSAILLYPMCVRTFQLGNTLGYYFNDLSCAAAAGLHFVGANPVFNIQQPEALEVNRAHVEAFLRALPTIRVHPAPKTAVESRLVIKQKCNCLQYCWENKDAAWSKHIDVVKWALHQAIEGYLSHFSASQRVTLINNKTDLCNRCDAPSNPSSFATELATKPPLVPEVAVQYRCGDNVGFGKTRYGLLPFRAISSRIPNSAKEIYVLADAASRSPHSVYSGRCGQILEALYKHLITRFPFSLVVIKRGGDIFLDVARMARAKILICSASTFCLWPALANPNIAHYPLTPLVLGAWTNTSAPFLGPSFHWIADYQMIKEFKSFRPWSKVIDALEAP